MAWRPLPGSDPAPQKTATLVFCGLLALGMLVNQGWSNWPGVLEGRKARPWQPATATLQRPCQRAEKSDSSHDFFLSPEDLRRGLAYLGGGARLRRAAARLAAGEPLHVAVVGGSTAWGQGALLGGSLGVRFFAWLNETYPAGGPVPHRFTNAAKPAISSALYALCGGDLVPHADIIILEFAFNDYFKGVTLESPPRAAFERLLRRMLAFPGSPAVLSLHLFAFWWAKADPSDPHSPALWYRTGEDDLAVLAQYYDVPVLSLRNAVLPRMVRGDPGFRVDLKDPSAALNLTTPGLAPASFSPLDDYFYFDDHHPWDRTGHRAAADLLVAAMQAAVEEAAPEGGAAPLPPITQPMFPGNYEIANPTCKLGEAFEGVVVRSQGFEWRPRKPGATTVESQKWAWVGEQPGAYAVLRLNTVVSTQPDEEPPQQQQKESQQQQQQQQKGLQAGKDGGSAAPTAAAAGGPTGAPDLARVWLSHVCSWQDLGSASVACVGGCACANATMDHWWQHERTLSDLFELEVTQHPRCEILVTVNPPGKLRTKKLKKGEAAAARHEGPATMLNAAMVTAAGGAGVRGLGNVGQWDMLGG